MQHGMPKPPRNPKPKGSKRSGTKGVPMPKRAPKINHVPKQAD
jgi:hypothetical protein